ncbi:Signal transduction histidine kinase [endosymbiont of Ridgeia piscesae]|uniref:histidine kinase n=3 Tax=endosymbiont of Ridgeia piscesae TaxID=54398 RepID=A0A0T5YUY4_9GAMM|nr:ATP-binding protein [endosymbiont of Ridgeia piscesae]KRT54381.1 Signal transduction histidine kinase [endosymbiont of Ridgeia piscesae]
MPKSLFGRLVLLLLTGLVLAQLLSAFILLRDRGQVLYESIRENLIVRTAGIVRLLDSLPAHDRQQLVPLLASPELQITLSEQPASIPEADQNSHPTSEMVRHQLLKQLPQHTEVRVSIESSVMEPQMPQMHRQHMMSGGPMSGPWAYMHGLHTMAQFFHIQVRLQDGTWVRFERGLSERMFDWPTRLLIVLAILLISVILLSLIGVRSIIRPLRDLRRAAEGLGKDIQQPPLKETGPAEVKDTAKAFNTMQTRLKNYIEDRASILAAVSHDLKTPLTRIRLRTDLMDDEELRAKTEKDLDDMESMVSATLDFMRGTETREPSQRLDLMALLESIQEDAQEAGEDVQLHGQIIAPYNGKPLALKRCIVNLVENAVRYGGQADIKIEDTEAEVVISICDKGPGIPEGSLQKVFDPFFRLESSRAQQTGGTGLGLGIARNIARAHGGDLILHNRSEDGLCAKLNLPR